MSDTQLDIVKLIAETTARTDDPAQPEFDPVADNEEVIGVLPMHLRHLAVLMADFEGPAYAGLPNEHIGQQMANALDFLMFVSINKYLSSVDTGKFTSVKIAENWQIVGSTEPSDMGHITLDVRIML